MTYEDALRIGWSLPPHAARAGAILLGLSRKIREYFPVGSGMNDLTGEHQKAYLQRHRRRR